MITFIIAGHYEFPNGIKETVQFITGEEKGVEICALGSDESANDYNNKLLSIINELPAEQKVVILCDLVGGTPFKEAFKISSAVNRETRIVTGINIPSILTGVMLRGSMEIDELVEEITKEGMEGIKSF